MDYVHYAFYKNPESQCIFLIMKGTVFMFMHSSISYLIIFLVLKDFNVE